MVALCGCQAIHTLDDGHKIVAPIFITWLQNDRAPPASVIAICPRWPTTSARLHHAGSHVALILPVVNASRIAPSAPTATRHFGALASTTI